MDEDQLRTLKHAVEEAQHVKPLTDQETRERARAELKWQFDTWWTVIWGGLLAGAFVWVVFSLMDKLLI